MGLQSVTFLVTLSVVVSAVHSAFEVTGSRNVTEKVSLPNASACPEFGPIENGVKRTVSELGGRTTESLHVECNPGYDLTGHPKVLCTDGQWERVTRPKCIKRCSTPPFMLNAEIVMEGLKDQYGRYYKSSSATYICGPGFRLFPDNSKFRTCRDGVWTGSQGVCISEGCDRPPEIPYGYYVLKSLSDGNGAAEGLKVSVGQRAHYSCNLGYMLDGPEILQCIETGGWSPRRAPQCIKTDQVVDDMDVDDDDDSCAALQPPAHTTVTPVDGVPPSSGVVTSGTVVEVRCKSGYRDERYPCEASVLKCVGGVWQGRRPDCELVDGCRSPSSIDGGFIFGQTADERYQVNAEIEYTCHPGHQLIGDAIYRCRPDGCWQPELLPKCEYFGCDYPHTTRDYTAYVWLMVTSLGAISFLVVIAAYFVAVCRRKRRLTIHRTSHHRSRHSSNPGSMMPPPGVVNSSATLLHDPDRVALIAFADGVTLGEALLPSYEEAIRDQRGHVLASAGLLGCRTLRPHWGPPRRARAPGSTPGDAHVTRQSSSTSHSASLRSGGESMGSTDTMTASDVSTNVTLDTVSSHTCSSGSQSASCRAIFGSLASFDTTSVLNTEGVPLLEENELEDGVQGSNPNLSLEPQVQDNSSYKSYLQSGAELA